MKKKKIILVCILFALSLIIVGFTLFKNDESYLKSEDTIFGEYDHYDIEVCEEYINKDIGQFIIFYKYGELRYSDSSATYVANKYYLAYSKCTQVVYILTPVDNSYVFNELSKSDGSAFTYNEFKDLIKSKKGE